jgi:hypothetical protein
MRFLAAAALALVLASSPARAQSAPAEPSAQAKEQARHLLDVGDTKMAEKDYRAALEAYRAADKIMGVPTTGLPLGKVLMQLGKLVEAHDVLLRVSRFKPATDADAFIEAKKEAGELAELIAPRLASLTVKLDDPKIPELRVTLDGAPLETATLGLPFPVDPGNHQIRANAPGYFDAQASAELQEKESKTIELTLKKDPKYKPPPPPAKPIVALPDPTPKWRALAYTGFAVGGAGLIVASVTGGVALSKRSKLKEACPVYCDKDSASTIDSLKTLSTVSTATWIVGGIGAATGIVGVALAIAQKPPQSPPQRGRWTPLVAPGFIGMGGSF